MAEQILCIKCSKPTTIDSIDECNCDCHMQIGQDCDVELKITLERKTLIELGLDEKDIEYFKGFFGKLVSNAIEGRGIFFQEEIHDLFALTIIESNKRTKKKESRIKWGIRDDTFE